MQHTWDTYGKYVQNLQEEDHSEDIGLDEKIILEWILVGMCGLHFSG
jgi:hypothetical protein